MSRNSQFSVYNFQFKGAARRRGAIARSVALLTAGAIATLCMPQAAGAVGPTLVRHDSEAEFATGEFKSTAVTSTGQLQLGRELTLKMASQAAGQVISAIVAVPGGTVYAASGADNTIYRIEGDKAEKFATPPGGLVTALAFTGKELLAGTSGEKDAGVYRIDNDGKAKLIWSDPDVKYVWACLLQRGELYIATGPKAKVFVFSVVGGNWQLPVGKAKLLYEAPPDLAKNILCLAVQNDKLYAGADENGLVIEIDIDKAQGRVVLDAPEKEISALVADGNGGIYVAASESSKAAAEGPGEGSGDVRLPATGRATSAPAVRGATAPAKTTMPVDAAPPPVMPVRTAPMPRPMPAAAGGPSTLDGPGNAVYYLSSEGLARPIFRRPVSILAMLLHDGRLILGAGNSGQIFSVDPATRQSVMLADTDASQVTCLAVGWDGDIIFGTANKGSVWQLGKGLARSGSFTSAPMDAQQVARWGTLQLGFSLPKGAAITVATRSGNLAKPDDRTWSPWSQETAATDGFIQIASPSARFLQYRLTMSCDGSATAAASDVRLVYQVGNLPPEIAKVQVSGPDEPAQGGPGGPPPGPAGSGGPTAQSTRNIAIQAADANNDQLVCTIEYRQVGSDNWIKIADKLDKPSYAWDTKTVADGKYELRVTASDSPSNPPATALSAVKVTSPVVVDNTAPVVKDLAAKSMDGKIAASAVATDGNRIVAIHYSLDSAADWTALLPVDGICDSNSEKVAFEVPSAKPGAHRLTVRATDAFGNMGYASTTVTVPEK